jgi:hypothetical protein
MIQALRYEPQGQRQRFEPREQQEQDRHIHLHVHLHLTFRARQGRSTPPNAIRLMRIFAALLGATVMPLWFFLYALSIQDSLPTTLSYLVNLACVSFFAGLALAWCAVGALLQDVWRASPRGRFGQFLPLVMLLLIPFSLLLCYWFGAIPPPLILLGILLFMVMVFVHPLITALLLTCVSREACALREVAPTHSKLGFVVVGGMVLMVLGGLLLNLTTVLSGGVPLLFLPAICIAIIVTLRTLLGLSRSRESTQARPKEASPSDVDSSGEP